MRIVAATEHFKHIQTIEYGPQPMFIVLKTGQEGDVAVKTNDTQSLTESTEWTREPGGVLRLNMARIGLDNKLVPIEITVPKGWKGELNFVGGPHRIKGEALELSRVSMHGVGKIEAEWIGQIAEMKVDLTGEVQWSAQQLKVNRLIWNSTGQGEISVSVKKVITGRLIGLFHFYYDGQPVISLQRAGQSTVSALRK